MSGSSIDSWEGASSETNDPSRLAKTRDKTKNILLKTKEKAKTALLPKKTSRDLQNEEEPSEIGKELASDPAFKPSLTSEKSREDPKDQQSSPLKSGLKSTAKAITHPRVVIGEKSAQVAAGQLSSGHSTYDTTGHDRDLVDAHDELAEVTKDISSNKSRSGNDDGRLEQAKSRIDRIESKKESQQTAWILGRHVSRVVNVHSVACQSLGDDFSPFKKLPRSTLNQIQRCADRYIDDIDQKTFDIKDLTLAFERFAYSSSHLQSWLGEVRRVYRWEDPKRTAKWLCIYTVLWYFQYLGAFAYGFIVYKAVRNLLFPTPLRDARRSVDKAEDHPEARARAWGDIVQQHGDKDWIKPLLESTGPIAQMNLGDITEMIESIHNFFAWTAPKRTLYSLFFFIVCLAITIVADMGFCVKVVEFIAGGWFFACAPIAARYPKYRKVVDPAKWVLWGIPNDPEAAIAVLQRRVEHAKIRKGLNELADSESSSESDYETGTSHADDSDDLGPHYTTVSSEVAESTVISSFRTIQHGVRGRLVIHTTGISFQSSSRRWSTEYTTLLEIVKGEETSKRKKAAKGRKTGKLELVFRDPTTTENRREVLSTRVDDRDEIFNLLLALSGLKWRAAWVQRPKDEASKGKARFFDAFC